MLFLLLTLIACSADEGASDDPVAKGEDLRPEDCLQTYGDNCGCEAHCMTADAIERVYAGEMCDMNCTIDSADPGWTCTAVDGVCVVEGQ